MTTIKTEINVSSKDFYNYLLNNLLLDVNKCFKEKKTKRELKTGFEYKKIIVQGTRRAEIDYKIIELKKDELYHICFLTANGYNEVKYAMTPIDDENCKIEYTEENTASKATEKFILSVLKPFGQKKLEKRIIKNLYLMADHINETKEKKKWQILT